MDWSSIGQGLATGLGAAVPLGVSVAWIIRRVFDLGRWKETLATKDDLDALRVATKKDIEVLRAATKKDIEETRAATKKDIEVLRADYEKAHAALSGRVEDTRAEVAELKSTVAGLASTVEGLATMMETTRADVTRIVDHLLGSKQE